MDNQDYIKTINIYKKLQQKSPLPFRAFIQNQTKDYKSYFQHFVNVNLIFQKNYQNTNQIMNSALRNNQYIPSELVVLMSKMTSLINNNTQLLFQSVRPLQSAPAQKQWEYQYQKFMLDNLKQFDIKQSDIRKITNPKLYILSDAFINFNRVYGFFYMSDIFSLILDRMKDSNSIPVYVGFSTIMQRFWLKILKQIGLQMTDEVQQLFTVQNKYGDKSKLYLITQTLSFMLDICILMFRQFIWLMSMFYYVTKPKSDNTQIYWKYVNMERSHIIINRLIRRQNFIHNLRQNLLDQQYKSNKNSTFNIIFKNNSPSLKTQNVNLQKNDFLKNFYQTIKYDALNSYQKKSIQNIYQESRQILQLYKPNLKQIQNKQTQNGNVHNLLNILIVQLSRLGYHFYGNNLYANQGFKKQNIKTNNQQIQNLSNLITSIKNFNNLTPLSQYEINSIQIVSQVNLNRYVLFMMLNAFFQTKSYTQINTNNITYQQCSFTQQAFQLQKNVGRAEITIKSQLRVYLKFLLNVDSIKSKALNILMQNFQVIQNSIYRGIISGNHYQKPLAKWIIQKYPGVQYKNLKQYHQNLFLMISQVKNDFDKAIQNEVNILDKKKEVQDQIQEEQKKQRERVQKLKLQQQQRKIAKQLQLKKDQQIQMKMMLQNQKKKQEQIRKQYQKTIYSLNVKFENSILHHQKQMQNNKNLTQQKQRQIQAEAEKVRQRQLQIKTIEAKLRLQQNLKNLLQQQKKEKANLLVEHANKQRQMIEQFQKEKRKLIQEKQMIQQQKQQIKRQLVLQKMYKKQLQQKRQYIQDDDQIQDQINENLQDQNNIELTEEERLKQLKLSSQILKQNGFFQQSNMVILNKLLNSQKNFQLQILQRNKFIKQLNQQVKNTRNLQLNEQQLRQISQNLKNKVQEQRLRVQKLQMKNKQDLNKKQQLEKQYLSQIQTKQNDLKKVKEQLQRIKPSLTQSGSILPLIELSQLKETEKEKMKHIVNIFFQNNQNPTQLIQKLSGIIIQNQSQIGKKIQQSKRKLIVNSFKLQNKSKMDKPLVDQFVTKIITTLEQYNIYDEIKYLLRRLNENQHLIKIFKQQNKQYDVIVLQNQNHSIKSILKYFQNQFQNYVQSIFTQSSWTKGLTSKDPVRNQIIRFIDQSKLPKNLKNQNYDAAWVRFKSTLQLFKKNLDKRKQHQIYDQNTLMASLNQVMGTNQSGTTTDKLNSYLKALVTKLTNNSNQLSQNIKQNQQSFQTIKCFIERYIETSLQLSKYASLYKIVLKSVLNKKNLTKEQQNDFLSLQTYFHSVIEKSKYYSSYCYHKKDQIMKILNAYKNKLDSKQQSIFQKELNEVQQTYSLEKQKIETKWKSLMKN